MDDIQRKLAHRVILLRNERSMTQNELADAADLTVEAVSRIERSKRVPRLGTLVKLSNGLEVSLSELFDFEGQKPRSAPGYRAEVRRVADLLVDQPRPKIRLIAKIAELVIRSN